MNAGTILTSLVDGLLIGVVYGLRDGAEPDLGRDASSTWRMARSFRWACLAYTCCSTDLD
jgi:hypothetical protein